MFRFFENENFAAKCIAGCVAGARAKINDMYLGI